MQTFKPYSYNRGCEDVYSANSTIIYIQTKGLLPASCSIKHRASMSSVHILHTYVAFTVKVRHCTAMYSNEIILVTNFDLAYGNIQIFQTLIFDVMHCYYLLSGRFYTYHMYIAEIGQSCRDTRADLADV